MELPDTIFFVAYTCRKGAVTTGHREVFKSKNLAEVHISLMLGDGWQIDDLEVLEVPLMLPAATPVSYRWPSGFHLDG